MSSARQATADPAKRATTGIDGILAGYTLLRPTEGWDYVHGILNDGKKEFMTRYAALRKPKVCASLRSTGATASTRRAAALSMLSPAVSTTAEARAYSGSRLTRMLRNSAIAERSSAIGRKSP